MPILGLTIPLALLASLGAALVSVLGLVAVGLNDEWARRHHGHFSAFAAGILVTTAVLLIGPTAHANEMAPYATLGGYLFMLFANLSLRQRAGAVLAPLVAIGLHSLLDGMEYALFFGHDHWTGGIAAIGLISHEFAEAVILYALVRSAGMSQSRAWILALLGAGLTTPLGTVIALPVVAGLSQDAFALLLATAAGALLHVGATHLTGEFTRSPTKRLVAIYASGAGLAIALSLLSGHGH